MRRETLSLALNSLDDRHITDTGPFLPRQYRAHRKGSFI